MSESINNREYRQKVLKEIISGLHEGKSVEEVKGLFEEAFNGVAASEISEAEGALIAEGLPITEIQKLCDVHAAVFKGSIEEIHQPEDQSLIPGHPANTLKRENRALEKIIDKQLEPYLQDLSSKESLVAVKEGIDRLSKVDIHYIRKENLFFPYLEKYGITAPPKVMWGVDDEIRQQIKGVKELLSKDAATDELRQEIKAVIERVKEMIFKEENILLPMLLETLTQDEWKLIAKESDEIGYLVETVPVWNPAAQAKAAVLEEAKETGVITMPTGLLHSEELIHMLNALPFDITFVDKEDVVKYFSQGEERIFPRTKTVIGRNVSNCHPPASVHIVEQIVEDFKSGKKDHEDFWIKMMDKYILIRYYAVRNEKKEYLGVLEVTQNIKPIQEITGEKRLVTKSE
ncbi:hypothetical protein acsn021_08790 [Anaerocolumna cellulosilytica]|uniref:Uncharacterized protein n=1 Tax=Anaerocolumna cellulosilytica TaxID=433286 RepID=A0A6S6R1X1_9FIRM|nr:DUF438 domain-containing protein [Anaerocolumna cellulosilytica]MBB5194367.1 hypothetical protein [Anaerocolumna cellulosilytica]BCJ93310.1 hypothetical protein acsn021_08790 [Anaerocolumna cellulosilytica]